MYICVFKSIEKNMEETQGYDAWVAYRIGTRGETVGFFFMYLK